MPSWHSAWRIRFSIYHLPFLICADGKSYDPANKLMKNGKWKRGRPRRNAPTELTPHQREFGLEDTKALNASSLNALSSLTLPPVRIFFFRDPKISNSRSADFARFACSSVLKTCVAAAR